VNRGRPRGAGGGQAPLREPRSVGEDEVVQFGAVDDPPSGVASFHLLREPLWRSPVALARLGTDRLRLRGTPGLRFARLLGTGRGATAVGADPSRTAVFAIWRDAAALAAFEDGWFAARAARVRAGGGEVYGVSLALLSGHGRWGGRDVLADLRRPRLPPDPPVAADAAGVEVRPIAVLTRATVRPSRWHRFRGSRPPVSHELAGARGLRAAVGIGEAPVGLQATFSIWSDGAAVAAFARSPEHRAVVRRTREEGWYGEELFARFTPLGSTGTWDGRDPLSRR
jgi:heme-degrading monooxygenase HmoA